MYSSARYLVSEIFKNIKKKSGCFIIKNSSNYIKILQIFQKINIISSFSVINGEVLVYLKYVNRKTLIKKIIVHKNYAKTNYLNKNKVCLLLKKNPRCVLIFFNNKGLFTHKEGFYSDSFGFLFIEIFF